MREKSKTVFYLSQTLSSDMTIDQPGGVGSPILAKFPHMLLMALEVNQFTSDQLL